MVPEMRADRRVVVLGAARMAEAFGNAFLTVVLPLFIASGVLTGGTFGLTEALLSGLLLSLPGLLDSLGQPFTGRLSDRLGRRKVFVLFGLAALAATNLAYLVVGTVLLLFVVRILQGLGSSFTTPATVALINDYATTNTRGENMGTYTTLRLVGTGLGPVVAGVVVSRGPYALGPFARSVTLSGFDAAFLIAAVGALASTALVWVYVDEPDSLRRRERTPVRELFEERWWRDPAFVVAAGALVFGIDIGLVVAIQPQVNAHLGQDPALFGLQLVAFGLPMAVLGPVFGRASDHLGRRPFLLGGLAVLAPTTLAQGLVTTPEGMLAARLAQGVAAAMAWAPAVALVGDVAGDHEAGTKLALLTMGLGVGAGISPVVSGYLVRFGYVTPFAVGAALAALALAVGLVTLEETHETDARLRALVGG